MNCIVTVTISGSLAELEILHDEVAILAELSVASEELLQLEKTCPQKKLPHLRELAMIGAIQVGSIDGERRRPASIKRGSRCWCCTRLQ